MKEDTREALMYDIVFILYFITGMIGGLWWFK
jgi:hypothetical protein